MTRRTATIAAIILTIAFAACASFWAGLHLPRATVIVWTGVTGVVAVVGIAVMLLTADRRDPFATPGEALAGVDPDEHLAPLRQATPAESALDAGFPRRYLLRPLSERKAETLRAKTARRALRLRGKRAVAGRDATSPAALSSSVPVLASSEEEAAPIDVPQPGTTYDGSGPRDVPGTDAGLGHPKRRGAHRQPRLKRRWTGVGGYHASPVGPPSRGWRSTVPAWAYAPVPGPVGTALPPAVPVAAMVLSAPPPDSPARETPAPRPEPSGAPGQGLAPGDGEVAVLCAGCATDDGHCDGEVPDCDCTCGLPPDWAEDGAADERLANTAERDAIDAGADWDLPWTAHAAAPVPVVDHEQAPATEEAPAELPGAEDCDPEPLFSDDNTIWRGLKALPAVADDTQAVTS